MYIPIIVLGGIFLINRSITTDDYIVYTMYTTTLLTSVSILLNFIELFKKVITGIYRFFEIQDIQPNFIDSDNALDMDVRNIKDDIKFNNVSFSTTIQMIKILKRRY